MLFLITVDLLLIFANYVSGQGLKGSDRQYKCDWRLDLVNRNQGIITKYVTPDTSIYQDITTLISNVDLTPDNSEVVNLLNN